MLSSKLHTIEFRLLVTGGRDFTDRDAIEHALLDIDVRPDVVIHGDSAGTDRIVGEVAEAHDLEVWKFPAQWRRYGNSAGPRRNYQMLVEGRPTHVLAFPGDRGTENMIMQASKAGIPVRRVDAGGRDITGGYPGLGYDASLSPNPVDIGELNRRTTSH